jgi:hypothetical protein
MSKSMRPMALRMKEQIFDMVLRRCLILSRFVSAHTEA